MLEVTTPTQPVKCVGKRDLFEEIKQMTRDGGALGALGDWAEHINLCGNAGAHLEVLLQRDARRSKNTVALDPKHD